MSDHNIQNIFENDFDFLELGREKTNELKEGERRNVAILFADISGFTALSEKLDHEIIQNLIDTLMNGFSKIVLKYGGYVDKYSGDEIMALFGAKIASEVDTQRAIYCGLEFIHSLNQFNQYIQTQPKFKNINEQIKIRIGINVGMVTAGKIGMKREGDFTVYGDVVNTASRIEKIAPTGSILVNNRTRRLVENEFKFTFFKEVEIKGKETPSKLYKVSTIKDEVNLHIPKKFITDEDRLNTLHKIQNILNKNLKNKFSVISISGEAGIGKSTLIQQSITPLNHRNSATVYWSSSSNVARSPFGIFVKLFKNILEIKHLDDNHVIQDKIDSLIISFNHNVDENDVKNIKFVLQFLLGQARLQKMNLKGKELETYLHRGLRLLIEHISFHHSKNTSSLILIFEDLHWIDEASYNALHYIFSTFDLVKFTPPKIIINYREKFHLKDEIAHRIEFNSFELEPFSFDAFEKLIENQFSGYPLDNKLIKSIFEQSHGNPFFLEEWIFLIKKLSKDGEINIDFKESIPDHVNAVVLSRVDLLSDDEKHILQCASVLGEEFSFKLLTSLLSSLFQIEDVENTINALIESLFIERHNLHKDIYNFRHVITEEVVYNSILNENKKKIHAQSGELIETLYADNLSLQYYKLANHFYKSENKEKSREYLKLAAHQAKLVFDNDHAIEFYLQYNSVLEEDDYTEKINSISNLCEVYTIIGELNKSKSILQNEVEKYESINPQLILDSTLVSDLGFTYFLLGEVDESESILEDYVSQKSKISEFNYIFACEKLAKVYADRGKINRAKQYFEENLKFQKNNSSKLEIVIGIRNIAEIDFRLGQLDNAFENFENSYILAGECNAYHEQSLALGNMGIIHLIKGEFNRASKIFQSVLDINEEIGDAIAISQSYGNLGISFKELRNFDQSIECYQQQLEICKNIQHKPGMALAYNNLGLVLSKMGEYSKSKSMLTSSLHLNEELGNPSEMAKVYGNLALVCQDLGEFQEAYQHFKNSGKLFNEIGDKRFSAMNLGDLASLFLNLKKYDKCKKYVKDSISAFNELHDYLNKVKYQLVLSELYSEVGDAEAAISLLEEALVTTQNHGIEDELILIEIDFGLRILESINNKNSNELYKWRDNSENKRKLTPELMAKIDYEIWKLTHDEKYKIQAISKFNQLIETSPKYIYKMRLEEMGA
jgi:class 3 adenylate cyclase/predicted ATPase